MRERRKTMIGRRTNQVVGLRSRWKGWAGGGLGFAAVAAILMFAAPFSSAHGAVTLSAPYTGFTSTASSYAYHSACASGTNSTPISWNATSGVAQYNGLARSGPCPGYLYGYSDGYVSIDSRLFHAPAPGIGYVYETFSSAFIAHASLHLATGNTTNGTYRGGSASVALYVYAEVFDETHHNGTLFGYAYTYLVDQSFYATSGSFSLTQGPTSTYLYVSGTFTAGHVYQVDTFVSAYVSADTYGGGSTAAASLDLSGTNGVTLSSITAY
jgi:hypothetical protein